MEKSMMTIEDYLKNNWDGTDASIDLVAEVVEPEGTKEELAKVKDLLGSYTTNYSTSSAGRCANISVAAGKINGTVLYPGEEFSVGQTIGPLTAAGGLNLQVLTRMDRPCSLMRRCMSGVNNVIQRSIKGGT